MAGNEVEVTIKGDPSHFNKAWKDSAGRMRDERGKFVASGNALGQGAGEGFASGFKGIGFGQLAGASFLGNIGASIASGLFDKSLQAIGKIKDALLEAASIETTTIAASSDVGKYLGMNIKGARSLMEDTSGKIAEVAAALPGVTKGYSEIFNAISGTIAEQSGGDKDKFQATSLDITKRAGVLGAIRNVDMSQAGNTLNRGIAGTMGLGELFLNDMFQKNPELMKAMRTGIKAIGKTEKDWKNLTTETRLGIVQNALKFATPDTLIKEFEGTTEAILQGMQTNLFDPIKGAFGMLRRVKSLGNRNALDGFNGFLKSWSRVTEAFGQILKANGVNTDPIVMIVKVFDFLTDVGNSIALFLQGSKNVNPGSILKDLTNWLAGLTPKGIASGFNEIRSNLMARFNDGIASVDWVQVGAFLASAVFKGIGVLASIATDPGFWYETARFLGSAILASVGILVGAIDQLVKSWVSEMTARVNEIIDFTRNLFSAIVEKIKSFTSGLVGPTPQATTANVAGVGAKAAIGTVSTIMNPVGALPAMAKLGAGLLPKEGPLGTVGNVVNKILDPFGKAPEAPKAINGPISAVPIAPKSTSNSVSNTFNPQVNVQAQTNADPNAIATATMSMIGQQYKQFNQGALG